LPERDVTPELVDQLGGLLERNAAKRSLENPGSAPLPYTAAPATLPGPTEPVATKPTTNGVIVPNHRRRFNLRRVARVLTGVVIIALLAGGAAIYWKSSHHHAAAPLIIVPKPVVLANLFVQTVPAGYVQQPDSVGDTGPSNLAKAVSDDGTAGAQAALTQDGFLSGYQRLWSTADQQQLVVFIYRFQSATGATAYLSRSVANIKASSTPAPTAFAVPGILGAIGMVAEQAGTHGAVVLFTRGGYLVQVEANGPTAATQIAVAQQIAPSQSLLIPAA
jgi:hypothetical protein